MKIPKEGFWSILVNEFFEHVKEGSPFDFQKWLRENKYDTIKDYAQLKIDRFKKNHPLYKKETNQRKTNVDQLAESILNSDNVSHVLLRAHRKGILKRRPLGIASVWVYYK